MTLDENEIRATVENLHDLMTEAGDKLREIEAEIEEFISLNPHQLDMARNLYSDMQFVGKEFSPQSLGNILMHFLPAGPLDGGRMTADDKKFWVEVADVVGPDWIAVMKQVIAFMDKTSTF